MSLAYSLKEGVAGFKRTKFASFASTSAMTIALTLIGVFGLLGFHADQAVDWLKQQAGEVEVFLTDSGVENVEALQEELEERSEITSVRFISKEEARRIFNEEFGQEGNLFLGDDESFLPPSFKVQVTATYAQVDSLEQLKGWLEEQVGVEEVVFNQSLLAQVQYNLKLFTIIALSIGLLVMLASLFLVANTIRLTIYARRLLIRTMKLVGAADDFIRRPFLFEGMLQGIIGGCIASLIVWGLHRIMLANIPWFSFDAWPLGSPVFGILLLILTGLLLGWIGSLFAVHRFIRKVELH